MAKMQGLVDTDSVKSTLRRMQAFETRTIPDSLVLSDISEQNRAQFTPAQEEAIARSHKIRMVFLHDERYSRLTAYPRTSELPEP